MSDWAGIGAGPDAGQVCRDGQHGAIACGPTLVRPHWASLLRVAGYAVVFVNGRYNGRTLSEWLPDVVARIVERFAPLQVIVFGSLAKGQEGPDSDIDLLVVLPHVEDKRQTAIEIGVACADFPVPVDIIVTDPKAISWVRAGIGPESCTN